MTGNLLELKSSSSQTTLEVLNCTELKSFPDSFLKFYDDSDNYYHHYVPNENYSGRCCR